MSNQDDRNNGSGEGAGQMADRLLDAGELVAQLQATIVLLREQIKALGIGFIDWAKEGERLADQLIALINANPPDAAAVQDAHEALKSHLAQAGPRDITAPRQP